MAQSIAVICGSVDQETMRMAAQLATKFQQGGYHIEIYEAARMPENFHAGAYEGVIVGAAMVDDEFPMELNRLVRHYRAQFHETTSGLFTIMSEDMAGKQIMVENLALAERTQWYPVLMASFGTDESSQEAVIQRMDFSATGRRRMGQIDVESDYHTTESGSADLFVEQFNEYIQHAREHPDMPLGPAGAP